MRATYQKRLAALLLGLRPTAAQIYGAEPQITVDTLSADGLSSWSVGLSMLGDDLAALDRPLTAPERWVGEWIMIETEREQRRWADASSVLELLALSLGPLSPDPSHRRSPSFWAKWTRNLEALDARLLSDRTWLSGDSEHLLGHCRELVEAHEGPSQVSYLLAGLATADAVVHHQPDVFRPLSTPSERLQLSAIIASAYSIDADVCVAAEARLLEQRPPLVTSCDRRRHLGRHSTTLEER